MARTGRPSDYTPELGREICQRIAQGESMRRIAQDKSLPNESTIFAWLAKHDEFAKNYARATQQRTNARYERIDSVIQDLRDGTIDHNIAKVEIDAIKWQLAKELPKKYGDKMALEHNVNESLADRLLNARKRVQDESGSE